MVWELTGLQAKPLHSLKSNTQYLKDVYWINKSPHIEGFVYVLHLYSSTTCLTLGNSKSLYRAFRQQYTNIVLLLCSIFSISHHRSESIYLYSNIILPSSFKSKNSIISFSLIYSFLASSIFSFIRMSISSSCNGSVALPSPGIPLAFGIPSNLTVVRGELKSNSICFLLFSSIFFLCLQRL